MDKLLKPDKQNGGILVAVLAIIALLSFLTTKFINDAVKDLEYRALFEHPTDFRAVAYNYLELSLAVVHEIALIDDGNIYDPKQGWEFPLEYFSGATNSNWDVSILIQDPCSKLPLNTLSKEELNDLLEDALDIDFSTTQELVDAWIDWTDEDETRSLNGAESEDYLDLDPPYRSANRPINSLSELKLIKTWKAEFFDELGAPNEKFMRLESLVTTLHDNPVNVNSASPLVLDYLLEKTSWDRESLLDTSNSPYLKVLPDSLQLSMLTCTTNLLNIQIKLMRGDVPFTLNALVEKNFNMGAVTSNLPGKDNLEDAILKAGSIEEQMKIKFPFIILEISETQPMDKTQRSYSQSNLDISLQ